MCSVCTCVTECGDFKKQQIGSILMCKQHGKRINELRFVVKTKYMFVFVLVCLFVCLFVCLYVCVCV